jgi:hypothetical protein
MAQVLNFPRTFTFDVILDEMPLYREGSWRGGCVWGRAEITYDTYQNDWHISDIVVNLDNGRCGAEARDKGVSLNGEDHPFLYAHLLDRITADYADTIEETVAMEMAEAA